MPLDAANQTLNTKLKTERARFTDKTRNSSPVPVHFNPVSLQVTISNTLEEKGQGKDKKQYVSKSTAKLSMDLVFDSTDSGQDVRLATGKLAKLMEPVGEQGEGKAPPVVLFEWGTYSFQGMVESYKETIDFFSHDGVPLRAAVSLTMSRQDAVFDSNARPREPQAVEVPAIQGNDIARSGGGRQLAAANGLESIRFPSGSLTIGGGVKLAGPAGAVGATASAGIGGAFAGLRVGGAAGGQSIGATRLDAPVAGVSVGGNSSFRVGGQANLEGSASLSTDIGASATSRARIRFDGQ